ncbi:hypothetical protein ACI68E_002538 [Malassezia pachydermatis]
MLRASSRLPASAAWRPTLGYRYAHLKGGAYKPSASLPPSPPPRSAWREQRWSSRTMVSLSTSVGFLMYFFGMMQGYKQGQAQAEAKALKADSLTSALPPI